MKIVTNSNVSLFLGILITLRITFSDLLYVIFKILIKSLMKRCFLIKNFDFLFHLIFSSDYFFVWGFGFKWFLFFGLGCLGKNFILLGLSVF